MPGTFCRYRQDREIPRRLRERAFGCFKGSGDENYATVWSQDECGAVHILPGVELGEAVLACVLELLEELEQRHRERRILLVGHGDPLQILWTLFAGLPVTADRQLDGLRPGPLFELTPSGG